MGAWVISAPTVAQVTAFGSQTNGICINKNGGVTQNLAPVKSTDSENSPQNPGCRVTGEQTCSEPVRI